MIPSAVFAATDLSSLRLVMETGGAVWALPPAASVAEGAPAESAESLRQSVAQAAAWIYEGADAGRRLSLLCLDVDHSQCLWLRSPSREEPALIAAARAASQDWGASTPIGSIQGLWEPPAQDQATGKAEQPPRQGPLQSLLSRLTAPRRPKSAAGAAPGVVLSIPDSLIRLLLDDLDERAGRVDHVLTLWHAMAAAWSPTDATQIDPKDATAIILLDRDRRAIWAWASAGALIVGGQVSLARAQPPREGEDRAPDPSPAQAVSRLSMDWLSWGAQLGTTPSRLIIVGSRGDELARALAERWPAAAAASCIPTADPIGDAIRRAAAALQDRSPGADPRRALIRLTMRPTRAVRARYRWAAVALVLFSLSLAAIAWRMQRAAVDMGAMAERTRGDIRARIESLNDPSLASARSPLLTLESKLAEMRTREAVKLPDAPKPVYTEIARALEVLAHYNSARLTQLNVDSRQQSQLQLIGLDRRTTEELVIKLEQLGGSLAWSRTTRGGASDQQVVFNGTWLRGE